MEYKLGKLAPKIDERTLELKDYVSLIAPPPATLDLTTGVATWPMFDNDQYGDCTCAAAGHIVEVWSALAQKEVVPEVSDVVAMYWSITDHQDTGAAELDVLKYWKKNPLAGVQPYAYTTVEVSSHERVKQAASLFGGVYIGVALPISAQSQVGTLWDVTDGPDAEAGSWGGHAINVVGYDADTLTIVTWGALQKLTWKFWDAYVDEAYAILPSDWQGVAGFDWNRLETDLSVL